MNNIFWLKEEHRQVRREICSSCEHNQDNVMCSKCGCFLIMITKIGTMPCPINKWPMIDRSEYGHIFEDASSVVK
jgi:hypothetical protein